MNPPSTEALTDAELDALPFTGKRLDQLWDLVAEHQGPLKDALSETLVALAQWTAAAKDRQKRISSDRQQIADLRAQVEKADGELALLKRTYNELFDAMAAEQARAEKAERELAEAKAQARTPGTVEVCPKCEQPNTLEDHGFVWDCCPLQGGGCPVNRVRSPSPSPGQNT